MNTVITPAPVRRSVSIKAAPARAFEVFTRDFGRWWPASHHIGKADIKDATIEPRAGGRWYETGVDGTICDWGKVLVWEPPHRLVLAWQISAAWSYDPDLITEVEVTFAPQGSGTLVTLEHRNLDRFGDAAETVRGQIGSDEGGWLMLLKAYAGFAN